MGSVDYMRKLPSHDEILKLSERHQKEKNKLLNQIKFLKEEKARIICDLIFWDRKCGTFEGIMIV